MDTIHYMQLSQELKVKSKGLISTILYSKYDERSQVSGLSHHIYGVISGVVAIAIVFPWH